MPSDLIRGWIPVRVKKTRQTNSLEPRFDSIETEKAPGPSTIELKCRRRSDHVAAGFFFALDFAGFGIGSATAAGLRSIDDRRPAVKV